MIYHARFKIRVKSLRKEQTSNVQTNMRRLIREKQKQQPNSPVILPLDFLFLRCFSRFSGSHLAFSSDSLSASFDIVQSVMPEHVVVVVVRSAEGSGTLKQAKRSLDPVSLTQSDELETGFSLVKLEQILSQTYLPTKGIPFSKSKFHARAFSSQSFLFSRSKSALICSWFTGPNNCLQTERLGIMFGLSLRGHGGRKLI